MLVTLGYPPNCVELHQIVILPSSQKKGYGRLFLNEVMNHFPTDIFARSLPPSRRFADIAAAAGFLNLGVAKANSETLLYLDRSGKASSIQAFLKSIGML